MPECIKVVVAESAQRWGRKATSLVLTRSMIYLQGEDIKPKTGEVEDHEKLLYKYPRKLECMTANCVVGDSYKGSGGVDDDGSGGGYEAASVSIGRKRFGFVVKPVPSLTIGRVN